MMSDSIGENPSRPSSTAVESARNLWTALSELTSGKKVKGSWSLIQACATQASLSKYGCAEKEIRPLSLNTLKAAAEEAVEPGGWKALDKLRKTAYLQSLPNKEQNRRAKRGLGYRLASAAEDNRTLEARVQALLRSRFVLLQAYSDIVDLLKTYQKLDSNLAKRLERHESMFDLKLFTEAEAKDERK